MELRGDDYCFGCGAANAAGLRLSFTIDERRRVARATFVPRQEHQGYTGITHGGILATALDEAMLKLCWELGIPAVTAKLEVRLRAPVPVGTPVTVRGWIEDDLGRVIKAAAEIHDGAGRAVAEARGTAVVKGPRRDGRFPAGGR